MPYIDGFLLACPSAGKDKYTRIASAAAEVFRKNGATEVVEAWGDDVPDGNLTSMPMAVKKTDDETVVFSWVAWPDKATRDTGMKAFMEDEQLKEMFPEVPFDGKRMMYGGFASLLDIPGGTVRGGYVDGMVAAVPDANREVYVKHANEACRIFAEYGAARCVESWGDEVPDGVHTSFPMAVKKEDGETVVFSYILWKDKAARDEGWKKIMEDERMKPGAMQMPFDAKRMIFGGFTPIVQSL